MPDREKVIRGPEVHLLPNSRCIGCPYPNNGICFDQLLRDALALLKEQEPVEPVKHEMPYGIYDAVKLEYRCGACGSGLRSLPKWRDKFCSVCGKAVKWNDSGRMGKRF